VNDPISDVDRPLDTARRYLVPRPSTWRDYTCCPWAKCLLAIDHENDTLVLCPVTCKRWGCSYCAVRKIRKLAFLTHGAAPNRWIRLGVDPKLYESPKDAWQQTAPQFPELFRRLRKKPIDNWHQKKKAGKLKPGTQCPEAAEIEYLKVTELHKSGYPHYHALLRSGYLPKDQMDACWSELTGAANYNWIAKIDNSFSSFRYLVKYLTKLHRLEWTDRHVSYSRGFFRAEDREKLAFPERAIIERIDEHPWTWLSNRYEREAVGLDDNGCYHLPQEYIGTPGCYNEAEVGLLDLRQRLQPQGEANLPTPKLVQRRLLEPDVPATRRQKEEHYIDASF
jgi:hypothetical protein